MLLGVAPSVDAGARLGRLRQRPGLVYTDPPCLPTSRLLRPRPRRRTRARTSAWWLRYVCFSSLNEAVAQAAKGSVAESGNGSRVGGPQANLDACTDAQWVTMRGELPSYPF